MIDPGSSRYSSSTAFTIRRPIHVASVEHGVGTMGGLAIRFVAVLVDQELGGTENVGGAGRRFDLRQPAAMASS